ncbi:MAG TPA: hypothetical protein VEA36_03615 [Candidatus Paceibacterota bacterium]|nr:hypothetical protein [Candidatus Paceibacterota bacterium]
MYATGTAFTIGPALSFLDPGKVVSVIAWVLFVLWAIYTAIAAYHWLRYSHQSSVAIPALIVHFIVSAALALFAVSGFAPS